MGGTEGQLAQVSPCLVPTFMVNTQHQVKHRPAGKPSYGNRHCRSKYFNYGSQTGRGLTLWACLLCRSGSAHVLSRYWLEVAKNTCLLPQRLGPLLGVLCPFRTIKGD